MREFAARNFTIAERAIGRTSERARTRISDANARAVSGGNLANSLSSEVELMRTYGSVHYFRALTRTSLLVTLARTTLAFTRDGIF